MKTRWLLFAAACCALTAADWPQWRGPERDGLSKETGLLKEWAKDGPKLAWQVADIGGGYSTPAVVGDRLYLVVNRGDDEFALALSANDGSEVWAVKLGKVGRNMGPQYPGARSTPTVDGDVLYCLGSDGDLACLETAKGKVRWQKNLKADFGGKPGQWAYAESPLVDGDALVCTPGGAKATLVALKKKDGEVIWKSEVPGGDAAGYASVVVTEAGGVKQYVQFLHDGVVGVAAKDGKFLWRYDKTAKGSPANIPTPVAYKEFVYSGAGRTGGGLVKVKADKDQFEAEQVYFGAALPTSIGGAVRVGDYLYGTSGTGLMCVEFTTGKEKWKDRSVGAASVCYADGRLYVHGENGEMALVEATPDRYKERGRFAPPEQPKHPRGQMEKAWAYPVVSNGKLYVRDQGTIWCYEVKAEK
jgi:outer membrane protein assembly factor BamB